MTAVPIEIFVGDVLIIGGGVAGLLTAFACERLGMTGALVEATAIGAEQSQHNHGYLHRGAIYLDASKPFVNALVRSREMMLSLLDTAGIAPVTATGNIGFTDPLTAAYATARWNALGIPVEPSASPPPAFARVREWFTTDEAAYDFTGLWRYIVGELSAVHAVHGRAVAVHVNGSRITSIDIETAVGTVRLTASAYVFAAGTGNVELMQAALGVHGRLVTRPSFMCVVDAPDLPRDSVVLPGMRNHGLFLVPRVRDDGNTVWMVGDFISLRGNITTTYDEWAWRRWIVHTLEKVTDAIGRPGVRIGSYAAPKGELRADVRYLGVHAVDDFGVANLAVVNPTKLTLGPILAEEASAHIRALLASEGHAQPSPDLSLLPKPPFGDEHWRNVRLLPVEDSLARPATIEPSLRPSSAPVRAEPPPPTPPAVGRDELAS